MTSSIACSISRMPIAASRARPRMMAAELLAHRRGEADRRLVQQQQRRVGRQRAHDLHHALLAAGQGAGAGWSARCADVHQREQLAALRGGVGFRCAPTRRPPSTMPKKPLRDLAVQPDQHVFERGQLVEQAAILEGAAHAAGGDLVRRQPLDRRAAQTGSAPAPTGT